MTDFINSIINSLDLLASRRITREQRFELLRPIETILSEMTAIEIDEIKKSKVYQSNKEFLYDVTAEYWRQQECKLVEEVVSNGVVTDLDKLFDVHIPLSAYEHEVAFFKGQCVSSILHIGSGAFPASAFVLEDSLPETEIACVERCTRSYELSCALADAVKSRVEILHADIVSLSDLSRYDCILFSLNVLEPDSLIEDLERKILQRTLIVARSATGWASLLYPEYVHSEAQCIAVPDNQRNVTRAALNYRWVHPQKFQN